MLSVIMLSVAMLSVVSPLILIIVSGLLICSKWINEPIFSIYSYDEKSFENYLKIFKKLLLICSFFISVNDKKINIKKYFSFCTWCSSTMPCHRAQTSLLRTCRSWYLLLICMMVVFSRSVPVFWCRCYKTFYVRNLRMVVIG